MTSGVGIIPKFTACGFVLVCPSLSLTVSYRRKVKNPIFLYRITSSLCNYALKYALNKTNFLTNQIELNEVRLK